MKREHDIVALLMADIASPGIVGAIDKALADNEHERQELLTLRTMAVWRHGDPTAESSGEPEAEDLDLTVADLVQRYRADPQSGYAALRFKTRENYESQLRRLENDIGPDKIASLDEEKLERQFEEWSAGGSRLPMARALIGMVRRLATYGSTLLKSRDCRELKLTLHDMRFERPAQSRSERLTRGQAEAIIRKAHETGQYSMALAQAFQMDCTLKQKDAIGEWVPLDEPGDSYLVDDETKTKWLHGLRWENINKDLMLNLVTSFGGELREINLKGAAFVMDELNAMLRRDGRDELPDQGPVIVHEKTGMPYLTHTFRREWRKLADAAGVPRNVKNMDAGVAGE